MMAHHRRYAMSRNDSISWYEFRGVLRQLDADYFRSLLKCAR